MAQRVFGSHNDYSGLQEAIEAVMDEANPDAEHIYWHVGKKCLNTYL